MNKQLQALGDVSACVVLAACSVVGYLVIVRYLIRIGGWMTTMPLH